MVRVGVWVYGVGLPSSEEDEVVVASVITPPRIGPMLVNWTRQDRDRDEYKYKDKVNDNDGDKDDDSGNDNDDHEDKRQQQVKVQKYESDKNVPTLGETGVGFYSVWGVGVGFGIGLAVRVRVRWFLC